MICYNKLISFDLKESWAMFVMKDLNLKLKRSSGAFYFILEGRINSSNSTIFNNAVVSNVPNNFNGSIIFDCEKLEYISSSGLRVLLTLKKKLNPNIKLINVSSEVNNILEVTGFSQIFEITQAIRDISGIEGQLIGNNENMAIYRMDNEMILKLYPEGTDFSDIERELNFTKTALLSGLPTLISYYAVIYNKRYGILYEMPNTKSVSSVIDFHKWKFDSYAKEMGKTLRAIHSCEPEDDSLPETSKFFIKNAIKMEQYLHDDEIDKIFKALRIIPEAKTIVYGNYHSGNVWIQNNELILIDMSGISKGNPIFDLGKTYMIYVEEAEMLSKSLTSLEVPMAKKFWDIMICSYFDAYGKKFTNYEENIIKAAAKLFSVLLPAMKNISKSDTERLIAKARQDFFPNIDSIINLLSLARFE